ncbi:hypothetical protein LZ32DRAFT_623513 [Colletotrichum eremochloae]|nr:hypothetical protein LZ32DRAFT_623513 [Colletotrichum eremochloae]
MAHTQFKKLDVKSMEQLYEKKERQRRQRAEEKRRLECKEQQQQHNQPQFPSTALAMGLEQNFGILSAKEAQTTNWTNSDPFDGIGNLEFDYCENLGIAESYAPCDFASLDSLAPCDNNPYLGFWLPCAPLPAQHSTEQASLNQTNPSSNEKLPSTFDSVRRVTGQLRLANPVTSGINASVVEVEDSSESSESCDVVKTSDDSSGSDDDETDVENFHQEMAVPGSELTRKDPSGSPVPHVLPEINTTAPTSRESSSAAIGLCLSGSAEAEAPFSSLCGLKGPQTANFSLPTPMSDHASDSGQGGHFVTCRQKREGEPTEDSRELRPTKRMRLRKVENENKETESPALPRRTLRALPSRVSEEKPSKKLSNQSKAQPRRSAGIPERTEADGPIDLVHCGKDTLRPRGTLQLDLDDSPKTIKYKEARRNRSPTISEVLSLRPNQLSGIHEQTERCGLVLPPPVTTTVNTLVATCHTCGFSAKHLLRIIDNFTAHNGGSCRLSDDERQMDMLEVFLGFMKNYATERLPHNETSTENNETYSPTHEDHTAEALMPDGNIDDYGGSQSDDPSDCDSSDPCPSPDSIEENAKRSKRRRWTKWEEERLRVYIEEGKEWSWIAKSLHRSEAAVTQHWVIMERQGKEMAK